MRDTFVLICIWVFCLQAPGQSRNIIFILADDHRHDAMGFTGKIPWLETPHFDRMRKEGMHVKNAFVSTALCSPSRASILTGMYAHSHTVVDNHAAEPQNLKYFPEYLQQAGYQTAFFGKWHMGNDDDNPRKGFHHWEGLRGQGQYFSPTLNINGERKKFGEEVYVTDLITEHALSWMKNRDKQQPFFVYLSHKGVHAEFMPAKRHEGRYKDKPIAYPPTYSLTQNDAYKTAYIPEWVKQQRHSWHGVDYMYHGQINFETFYRKYCETLLSVDESVGAVLEYLRANGLAENTLVVYMGDNGFSFGEHGLIDKRHAYEESMRVPMLAWGPGTVPPGTETTALVQNIDVAPTLLSYAGIEVSEKMQGKSFLPSLRDPKVKGRDRIFYEYYWEYDFPQTPTMFALRTDTYKYIHYYGIWSQNELYDLSKDPQESKNLINDPAFASISKEFSASIFSWLEGTDGMYIPLKRNARPKNDHLYKGQY